MIFISPATACRSVIVPILRCSASGHTWFIDSPLNCALPLHTFILCSGRGACLLCTLFWTRCFPLHTSAESYAFTRCRVAEVAREHGWHPLKSLDSDENFKPKHALFCCELRFVAIYALFFGDLWAKKVPFWVKTVLLGQEVHYYMVYIAYFTVFNLQICDPLYIIFLQKKEQIFIHNFAKSSRKINF